MFLQRTTQRKVHVITTYSFTTFEQLIHPATDYAKVLARRK